MQIIVLLHVVLVTLFTLPFFNSPGSAGVLDSHISMARAKELHLVESVPISFWNRLLLLGSKQLHSITPTQQVEYPEKAKKQKFVNKLFERIDELNLFNTVALFTSFYTRSYTKDTGRQSAEWLEQKLIEVAGPDAIVKRIDHNWPQFSLVATIPPADPKSTSKVIVSCHQDSTSFMPFGRAPGADDSATAVAAVVEIFRLVSNFERFHPQLTIEFHFHSAEEGGLLGSSETYESYKANNESVVGILHFDMVGYTSLSPEKHFGVVQDYTSPKLTSFVELLIETYSGVPHRPTACGYACSDHAAAMRNGFPAAFVIESELKYTNKFIHTAWDTVDRIDWSHVKEAVKLGIAYAFELGT